MKKAKILIVEDEALIALELKLKIESIDFQVISVVPSGEQAVEAAKKHHPNLILMDIMLKGNVDGIQAASQIKADQDIPIIYMTGNSHLKTDKRLLATMPVAVLAKPVMEWELFEVIEQALK